MHPGTKNILKSGVKYFRLTRIPIIRKLTSNRFMINLMSLELFLFRKRFRIPIIHRTAVMRKKIQLQVEFMITR
jgi:hypothetical protein